MPLSPPLIRQYHVFLASPADVDAERKHVRKFFDDYNRHTAHIWSARFEVVDWENYSTAGVGRPQELITRQTLERHQDSLALVVGIMSQRFGSPTGRAESGTEEEFNWAMEFRKDKGFPEIKWFFRKIDKLELPADADEAEKAIGQWRKVQAFRKRMHDLKDPLFYTEYPTPSGFAAIFERDLNQWLAASARPWAEEQVRRIAGGTAASVALPAQLNAERYRDALLMRFEKLTFEMLDATGAYYSGVKLWSVFVPQSARECNQYNPRLLEIPKEHQERLLHSGELSAAELKKAEEQGDRLRKEYFNQPRREVLNVVDDALQLRGTASAGKLVILGDPGSGKSSLIRYLALRWARMSEPSLRETQPIPLVIDLGKYARWQCDGQRGFIRFLEEAPVWYEWTPGLLSRMLDQVGRVMLLLDGLDEIFNVTAREGVVDDIQRFSRQFPQIPIVITSRVVGYQAQRLRDADFRHFMLQDLDPGQIDAFVKRWHFETFENEEEAAPKRSRMQKAIGDSKSIAMLAGNPLLLTLMAILNRTQELPRDRADLYAQASRLLLHQWDTERALADFPGLRADIGLREKTEILRRVAAQMQATADGLKGNLIDAATLTDVIERYLRDELHFDQARAAARTAVEHMRLRNFIICFIGADSYAFVHRTFLEYFCAVDVVYRFNVSKVLSVDGLLSLFKEHCDQEEWREVLRLVCGEIDETFVAAIVQYLLNPAAIETWDGHEYLHELGLCLAIVTEVRNPTALGSAGETLLDCLLLALERAAGPRRSQIMIEQTEEMAVAAEAIGTRWPGLKQRMPIPAPSPHRWLHGGGMLIWPRIAVAFEGGDRQNGLRAFALNGVEPDLRAGALQPLVERWPEESTRALLLHVASNDVDDFPRAAALRLLAERWCDESTRVLLVERVCDDKHSEVRSAALRALAQYWLDENTRALLVRRAVDDRAPGIRSYALTTLAHNWPEDDIRSLLVQRAIDDNDADPRSTALVALAENWKDEGTRTLLVQRAVDDNNEKPRSIALRALVKHWPDEKTRMFLVQRAVDDNDAKPRTAALVALVKKWTDDKTRTLLVHRAVDDNDANPRFTALNALAENWKDEGTRTLLVQRAIDDNDADARCTALNALAENWKDEGTRTLLAQRAIDDNDADVRCTALNALAEKWKDEGTRTLLAQRLINDPAPLSRGTAFCALGAMHSEFGRVLPTLDLDGRQPYLDPLEPISPEQIKRAATHAQIGPEEVEAAVESLSGYLGWDITRGAIPARGKRPRTKRKKKLPKSAED